jgi:hypothetical protein
MATAQLKGNAEIEYDDGVYTVVHLLAVPLLVSPAAGFRSTRRRRLYTTWSADQRIRETFTLGEPVDEIVGTVRFDNQPTELRELIRAGLEDDAAMIYRPYGLTGDEFPCKLVATLDGDAGEIVLTPDRVGFKEYTVGLVLRRVDGGTFESLLDGGAVGS